MKCDELKPIYIVEGYEQDPNLGKFTRPTILRYDILAYRKDDADSVIAELKAENERLVKCCKEYDSRQRIDERIKFNGAEQLRKTKHALWMSRKAHAVAMFSFWDSHYKDNPNAVYRNRTINWLRNRWLLILYAIIKKEKEYKQ